MDGEIDDGVNLVCRDTLSLQRMERSHTDREMEFKKKIEKQSTKKKKTGGEDEAKLELK